MSQDVRLFASIEPSRASSYCQSAENMKPWSSSAKWGIFLLSLGVIGGIALMVIASHGFYGVIGSPGYIAGMAAGAVLFGLCVLAIIAIVAVQIVLKKAQPIAIIESNITLYSDPNLDNWFPKGSFAEAALKDLNGELMMLYYTFPGEGVTQPSNLVIFRLAHVLYKNRIPEFFKKLHGNPQDSWAEEEVVQASKEMMEMAYALAHFTMQDLISDHEQKDLPNKLREKEGYYIQVFYTFTSLYHFIRGGGTWDFINNCPSPAESINSEHSQAFYQTGTTQHMIREHFNYFCDFIQKKIPNFTLGDRQLKLSDWVKQDTDESSYESQYETLETFPFTNYITLLKFDDYVPYYSGESEED